LHLVTSLVQTTVCQATSPCFWCSHQLLQMLSKTIPKFLLESGFSGDCRVHSAESALTERAAKRSFHWAPVLPFDDDAKCCLEIFLLACWGDQVVYVILASPEIMVASCSIDDKHTAAAKTTQNNAERSCRRRLVVFGEVQVIKCFNQRHNNTVRYGDFNSIRLLRCFTSIRLIL
jgi:hypothetical protein